MLNNLCLYFNFLMISLVSNISPDQNELARMNADLIFGKNENYFPKQFNPHALSIYLQLHGLNQYQ